MYLVYFHTVHEVSTIQRSVARVKVPGLNQFRMGFEGFSTMTFVSS